MPLKGVCRCGHTNHLQSCNRRDSTQEQENGMRQVASRTNVSKCAALVTHLVRPGAGMGMPEMFAKQMQRVWWEGSLCVAVVIHSSAWFRELLFVFGEALRVEQHGPWLFDTLV